jgi:hypothetical protein
MSSRFNYHSEQVHSTFHNGEGQTKVHTVNIRNGKGTKSVTLRNPRGRVMKHSTKKLTQKEIDCIRNCQFIPGLFRDCQACINMQNTSGIKRRKTRRSKTQE